MTMFRLGINNVRGLILIRGLLVNFYSIAVDANVQVYTTSNKVMNILDRLHRD